MAFPSDLVRTKNWGTELLTDSDMEGQLDLIINWVMASLDATTGHNHDGTSNQSKKISPANLLIASQAQGDILYASSATVWARLGAGTNGYFLKTQGAGANPIWADATHTPTAANALSGSVVQMVRTSTTTGATCSTAIPIDDTIPQNTEGDQVLTLAITPNHASNILEIEFDSWCSAGSAGQNIVVALFQDSTANALQVSNTMNASTTATVVRLRYLMAAGTTSATTFKIRIGGNATVYHLLDGSGVSKNSTADSAVLTIKEYKA